MRVSLEWTQTRGTPSIATHLHVLTEIQEAGGPSTITAPGIDRSPVSKCTITTVSQSSPVPKCKGTIYQTLQQDMYDLKETKPRLGLMLKGAD